MLFELRCRGCRRLLGKGDGVFEIKCPHCKEGISFSFFADRYSTPLGDIQEEIEDNYNADAEFMEFCLDTGLLEELDDNISAFLDKRVKEHYKRFKGIQNEKNR